MSSSRFRPFTKLSNRNHNLPGDSCSLDVLALFPEPRWRNHENIHLSPRPRCSKDSATDTAQNVMRMGLYQIWREIRDCHQFISVFLPPCLHLHPACVGIRAYHFPKRLSAKHLTRILCWLCLDQTPGLVEPWSVFWSASGSVS